MYCPAYCIQYYRFFRLNHFQLERCKIVSLYDKALGHFVRFVVLVLNALLAVGSSSVFPKTEDNHQDGGREEKTLVD